MASKNGTVNITTICQNVVVCICRPSRSSTVLSLEPSKRPLEAVLGKGHKIEFANIWYMRRSYYSVFSARPTVSLVEEVPHVY